MANQRREETYGRNRTYANRQASAQRLVDALAQQNENVGMQNFVNRVNRMGNRQHGYNLPTQQWKSTTGESGTIYPRQNRTRTLRRDRRTNQRTLTGHYSGNNNDR